ncbi:hypothetical protein KKC91_12960 [bacterium]|nr:hypothetical protein [bacterium]
MTSNEFIEGLREEGLPEDDLLAISEILETAKRTGRLTKKQKAEINAILAAADDAFKAADEAEAQRLEKEADALEAYANELDAVVRAAAGDRAQLSAASGILEAAKRAGHLTKKQKAEVETILANVEAATEALAEAGRRGPLLSRPTRTN